MMGAMMLPYYKSVMIVDGHFAAVVMAVIMDIQFVQSRTIHNTVLYSIT